MRTIRPAHMETAEVMDVMGLTVQFLTHPLEAATPYCVMRATIPPGVAVPLHSHPDVETIYVLCGQAQAMVADGGAFVWRDIRAGDCLHIPSSVPHAHRNVTDQPVVELIVTTTSIGRFYKEIGRRVVPGEPLPVSGPDELQRYGEVAARYQHWLASPEENEAIGILLPTPA